MNKIYDKLLLAVAVLILAGGVFLYMQKTGETPSLDTPINVDTANNPYVPQKVPTAATSDANWPEVLPQSTGWRYDVFTPPKIFIDENGQFTQTGWEPPVPPPPFGVYLAAIERKPYRIQLEGYIEEDRSDPSKTLLLLFDEEARVQVRARPGDEKPASEFNLLNFDIQRIRDADNNVEVVAKATILDKRTGDEVVLIHGERRYDSGVTVIIKSEQDSGYTQELVEAPTTFEGPAGQYTLLEINPEESTVVVEKQAVEGQEAAVKTLRVRSLAPTTLLENTTPANNTNTAPANIFDTF